MRESADDKARRLLVERRVNVLKADEHGVWALVRGDGATYRAKWQRSGSGIMVGQCTCAAINERCSHLTALRYFWTGERR